MYRGKKFNSRKEDVIGDDYLGIKKYRFYIKCCVCNNEIAFKTDPKNQDYVCESGATRNFESWRQQDEAEEKFEGERKEAAEANAMSALESKTLDSKIEMDILDALDEIKAYNERHERVDRAELGSAQKPADEMSAKERDEMAAFKRAQAARAVDAKPPPLQGSSSDEAVPPSPPAPVVLKRRLADAPPPVEKKPKLADAPPPVEKKPKLGGLVAYSSSSSS